MILWMHICAGECRETRISLLKEVIFLFLKEKSAIKFIVGVLLGLAFSMAVILSTIGLMDGFDLALKSGLKRSLGDITVFSHRGFFPLSKDLSKKLADVGVKDYSALVQTEGFVIGNENSKGVLVKGVDGNSFSQVTGIEIVLKDREIVIGKELARQLQIKEGETLVLALARGNRELSSLPQLQRYTVCRIISHGIYQQDMRLVYVKRLELQKMLNLQDKVNVILLNVPERLLHKDDYDQSISDFRYRLEGTLGMEFGVRPFWQEYSSLIEAVKIQKFVIGLMLQLIVVIASFNVMAFVIFINERKAKEIFLLKSLGLSQARLLKIWLLMVGGVWVISCMVSWPMVKFFGMALANFSVFQLPGDIYYLADRMRLHLEWLDYTIVFVSTLFWLLCISSVVLIRMRRKTILAGLRREFA